MTDTYRDGDDRVQIRLGDDELHICTAYEVRSGIFDQPSTFSVQIGNGKVARDLLRRYPPMTPFQLVVGDAPQFSGYTEGREASGTASSGTVVHIHGRSVLAGLLSDVATEKTFTANTHRQMVENAIGSLGLRRPFGGGALVSVLSSNMANTEARTAAILRSQQQALAIEQKRLADQATANAARATALADATRKRLAAESLLTQPQKQYDTLIHSMAVLKNTSPAALKEAAAQLKRLNDLKAFVATFVAAEAALNTGTRVDSSDLLDQLAGSVGNDLPHMRAKLGEKWFDLLRKHLELAGLFLWDSFDGNIVVAQPQTDGTPMGRIVRVRDKSASNVESFKWREDYASRFSEVNVFCRSTGADFGRGDVSAEYHDTAMEAYGFKRLKVIHGKHVTSPAQAKALAHRALFAGQRNGFALEYTVKGHSTTSLKTGGPVVWAPDTLVDVVDDELGISGLYYLETVTHTRNGSGTHSHLKLLPPASLIFGSEED